MVTPFDNLNTNNFLDVTSLFNISAIIIVAESSIDAAGTYDEPKIISMANVEDANIIRAYSYPVYKERV